jgi:hypothetical protein
VSFFPHSETVLTLYMILWTKLCSFSYVSFSSRAILVELSAMYVSVPEIGIESGSHLSARKKIMLNGKNEPTGQGFF